MSGFDSLVGQSFRRNGRRWVIVRCDGVTVIAKAEGAVDAAAVAIPLADVLDAFEVPEITVTELPVLAEERRRA